MSEPILEVSGLSHRYGKNWAVQDIEFAITQPGAILGLLGSNGAGKSTTLNIISGVLRQTQGKVYINGIDLAAQPVRAKRHLGFLPQVAPLYGDLTVDEYLDFCAKLRRMERSAVSRAVSRVKEECGLAEKGKKLLRNLSGGYRQRVGIAQAIIHQPALVILDEPTNGLDPVQIQEVRKLIKRIAAGRAVIFSSHILSEVQATCTGIRMIENGRQVFSGTVNDFNSYLRPDKLLVCWAEPPLPKKILDIEGVSEVEDAGNGYFYLKVAEPGAVAEKVVGQSIKNGWRLKELTPQKVSLDEIFSHLSGRS